MRIFKRILLILAICIGLSPVILYAVIWCGLAIAVSVNFSDLVQADDGFSYLIRDGVKKGGVCGYIYDPKSDNNVIEIPEYYEDYPVKSLGGHIGKGGPCPFDIDIKGIRAPHIGLSDGTFDWYIQRENLNTVYYDLVLNIGPNIREIYANQDGLQVGKQLHIVRVYINCDPGNPSFYSEDGILYQKNGKVVDGFLYWNQSYTADNG